MAFFLRRHTVGHDLAGRARASYVTAGRGVDGSAYLEKTGSMRAINSSYPVSLDCGCTSSDVMCAFSAKEQIDLFHHEACYLDTFRSLVSYVLTLSATTTSKTVGKTVVVVDLYFWGEIRGSPMRGQQPGEI